MNFFFYIALFVACFCVLAVLGLGLFAMVKGGEFNKKHGNKLMQARVFLQGIALGLFFLAYLTSQSGS
jgi:hypothetical protein